MNLAFGALLIGGGTLFLLSEEEEENIWCRENFCPKILPIFLGLFLDWGHWGLLLPMESGAGDLTITCPLRGACWTGPGASVADFCCCFCWGDKVGAVGIGGRGGKFMDLC